MSIKGALLRSSLFTGGVMVLRIITQAFTLVLLTRLLGPEIFGAFASAATLAVVMGIIPTLGAGFVMMSRAPHGEDAIQDVWRYSWPLTIIISIMLLVIYLPLGRLIAGEYALDWIILLGIGVAELLLMPFVALLSFVLQAHERVPLSQLMQWIPLGLRVLAIMPCFLFADAERLNAYVVFQIAATTMGLVAGLALLFVSVRVGWVPRVARRDEMKEGVSYTIMHVIAANASELDKILAVRMVGGAEAGIYVAASRVMGALVAPVTALLLAAQPRLFMHKNMKLAQIESLIKLIALISFGLGCVCSLLLLVSEPILLMLFGGQFVGMGSLIHWLAIAAIPLSLRIAAGAILVAFCQPSRRIMIDLFGIGLLMTAMVILGPLLGAKGMAMSLIISEAGMSIVGWILIKVTLHNYA